MLPYTETTREITVTVHALPMEERTNVIAQQFLFVYFITITNHGSEPVRLRRRHWFIFDPVGGDHEVEGEGVVGEQPLIAPGESHRYNSYCMLSSFQGAMEGSYTMEQEDGTTFEVAIPRFHLQYRMN